MSPRAFTSFALLAGIVLLGASARDLVAAEPAGGTADRITLPGLNYALVKVPAGVVVMGHGDASSRSDESPATRVTLSQPFWVGVTKVTVAQWQYFFDTAGYVTEAEIGGTGINLLKEKAGPKHRGMSWRNPGFPQDDAHPVVGISWQDAMQFCRWLTERESSAGRLPAGYIYTLPTEAQWEYACRAGGNEELSILPEYWPGHVPTRPVMTRSPNAWGLYDMYGIPLEWVFDWYGRYPGGELTDYAGPVSPNDRNIIRAHHEVRGQDGSRNRWSTTGDTQSDFVGIRIALAPPPHPVSPPPEARGGKK